MNYKNKNFMIIKIIIIIIGFRLFKKIKKFVIIIDLRIIIQLGMIIIIIIIVRLLKLVIRIKNIIIWLIFNNRLLKIKNRKKVKNHLI